MTDLETEVYEFKTIGRNPVGTSPPSDVTEARPQEGPVIGSKRLMTCVNAKIQLLLLSAECAKMER